MNTSKTSNITDFDKSNPVNWVKEVDNDLNIIFMALQGRIRFGANSGRINKGENILGQFVTYTTNGSANTEDTVSHNLGSVPVGYIVVKINKGGVIYDSGTSWTSSNLYLKCTTTSTVATLFLLQ